MILDDMRTLSLKDWLENDLLLEIHAFAPASSDASFRRYFRVATADGNQIVMDAPPEKENTAAFIHVAELMLAAGVRVPRIYQQNLDDGFLLLEDFGSQCFLDQLNQDNVDTLYNNAFASLLSLQTNTPLATCGLNRYDHALLTRELGIFAEWFIDQYLDATLPDKLWTGVCDTLIASALEQPVTCVHRDFHSRNLMVLPDQQAGVIDFQDAVIGPITYDAVSLLRDCYIAWPSEQVAAFRDHYFQQLLAAKLIDCPPEQFQRWFDLMGMQRHLKAIGIFARLHLRDGKSNYLNDIPRTLNYVLQVCGHYPELSPFGEFLQAQVAPKLGAST
ncbi:phosphotransferase [Methylosoma difficile]